ncbi:hypothetical protein K458DRAFT_392051 [Lentithecium fluviatile CBS 122367]|uniref:Uncharacterized protein n=1 Tax=Lentithecium fluviatile CBS 122367 TaxID=1168545 RepID=A0A6G1ITJ2_9PLEO|nr:hypothetical protein K458DRAFT_392051 [Lentithecium fluviatile CBS 122367]
MDTVIMSDRCHLRPGPRAPIKLRAANSYGTPSRAAPIPSAESLPAPRPQDLKTPKQKSMKEVEFVHNSRISLTQYNHRGYFITTTKPYPRPSHTEIHQSTCLNLNLTTTPSDSDLWILPDFDEWEADTESPQQEASPMRNGQLAPLLARAVNSNRERLRRRLEGDGWDFVGGKYGEDGKLLKDLDVDMGMGSGSEESVDEEFDVVVLPRVVEVAC